MTEEASNYLKKAVDLHRNILVAGGTGSGKTTLVNAVLQEIGKTGDRILILEDTRELQCSALNKDVLTTTSGVTINDLLRSTMRRDPTRIVVGEVRGGEALSLLKAWNTGHPGGCCTVHADSAKKALSRLEQLVFEAGLMHSQSLIGEAVDVIVYIEKTSEGRRIKEIVEIDWQDGSYQITDQLAKPDLGPK